VAVGATGVVGVAVALSMGAKDGASVADGVLVRCVIEVTAAVGDGVGVLSTIV
jgi:hypothetical protein